VLRGEVEQRLALLGLLAARMKTTRTEDREDALTIITAPASTYP